MFNWKEGTVIWAYSRIEKCALDGSRDPGFFENFRKKSYQGEIDFSKYHVGGKDGEYSWDPDIYKDASLGLILRYGGQTRAVICFGITKINGDSYIKPDNLDTITDEAPLIVQIQGMNYSSEFLEAIKWERLLVAAVEREAQDAGFKYCAIQPSSRNKEMRLDEKCHLRYDITAKRSGYQMQNGLWLKQLIANTTC